MALVFWDQYARYPAVEFTSSTSADYVIPQFTRVFNTYGIPEEIKSDNGPPFNGSKFANFAQEQEFRHQKVTLGWAEANGDVERYMQTLKKSARTSILEGNLFGRECKERLAAIAPRPTQRQRKAVTCSCSAESYGGSYRKDRTRRRNSIRPNQTKRRG